jgi:D-alanyl-D-alanine carboxypeptidase/D-alanyl-D-alanine-endopeptidase (penicillin-binding protein 4)
MRRRLRVTYVAIPLLLSLCTPIAIEQVQAASLSVPMVVAVGPPAIPAQVLPASTGAGTANAGGSSAEPNATSWTSALDAALSDKALGVDVTGQVTQFPAGTSLYSKASKRPQHPASTIKILTALAVLKALGPDARLATTVSLGSEPGQIVLRGGGDATLARVDSKAAGWPAGQAAHPATLNALAIKTAVALRKAGLTSVTVDFDDSLFVGSTVAPGWKPSFVAAGVVSPVMALSADGGRTSAASTSRSQDPAKAAASYFAERLRARGITVATSIGRVSPVSVSPVETPGATATPAPTPLPSGATSSTDPAVSPSSASGLVLASVESPPMSDLVERMLTRSDDDLAEALGHLAGGRLVGSASFEGGVRATYDTLEQLGMPMRGLKLADASGLSSLNELDSTTFTHALAAAVADKPFIGTTVGTLWPVTSGLPIAGVTGTLSDRFTSAKTIAGRGVVRAKTGTLTGVIGLAGIVQDPHGRILIFDFDADHAPGPIATARAAVDRAATIVATG